MSTDKTAIDLNYSEETGDFVKGTLEFPKETSLSDIPAILRAAADKLDSVGDYVDLDNLEPLADVGKRNRRMLDEIIRGDPSAAFQKPLGNGEL